MPLRHLVSVIESPGIREIFKTEIQKTLQNLTAHDKWEVLKSGISRDCDFLKKDSLLSISGDNLKSLVLYYMVVLLGKKFFFSFLWNTNSQILHELKSIYMCSTELEKLKALAFDIFLRTMFEVKFTLTKYYTPI